MTLRRFVLPQRLLLAVVAGLALLVVYARPPGDGRWAGVLADAAHVPVFAAICLIVLVLRQRSESATPHAGLEYIVAVLLTVSLGVFVELAQMLLGRDASPGDVVRDVIGALAGCVMFSLLDERIVDVPSSRAIRAAYVAFGIFAVAWVLLPVLTAVTAYRERDARFPVLADFTAARGLYFVGQESAPAIEQVSLPAAMRTDGVAESALHARVRVGERWEIALHETVPDWRGYGSICLDLANPTGGILKMRVRIHDRNPDVDWLSGRLENARIPPQTRATRCISFESTARPVDLSSIHAVVLSGADTNAAPEFYLVRVWLE
jgi:VanZ family protein